MDHLLILKEVSYQCEAQIQFLSPVLFVKQDLIQYQKHVQYRNPLSQYSVCRLQFLKSPEYH